MDCYRSESDKQDGIKDIVRSDSANNCSYPAESGSQRSGDIRDKSAESMGIHRLFSFRNIYFIKLCTAFKIHAMDIHATNGSIASQLKNVASPSKRAVINSDIFNYPSYNTKYTKSSYTE